MAPFHVYDESNFLISKSNFKNDSLDGTYKEYYISGKVGLTGEYRTGKKDGTWTEYSEYGKVLFTNEYNNGIKTGEWKYYYPNTKIERIEKLTKME